jgi:chaperonin GroEL
MKGFMQFAQIGVPDISYRGGEMMEDIALLTGGKYFSESSGDNFEMMQANDLGTAPKVVIGLTHTVILTGDMDAETKARVAGRAEEIEQKIKEASDPKEIAYLKERLSNLIGGIGVVYVGAVSDIELKEKRDRVDDACCAVASAIDGGIVPGGGIALLDIANEMTYGEDESGRVAWHILKGALEAPYKQILTNGGFKPVSLQKGQGFDVAKGEVVNILESGIVDPCKVTRQALENALSVACTIISTDCIVTNARVES